MNDENSKFDDDEICENGDNEYDDDDEIYDDDDDSGYGPGSYFVRAMNKDD